MLELLHKQNLTFYSNLLKSLGVYFKCNWVSSAEVQVAFGVETEVILLKSGNCKNPTQPRQGTWL